MSTSVPTDSEDRRLTPQPVLVDEAALKRVFDEQFPTLLATAQRELGDAAVQAPRVVEGVFCQAWRERARLYTPAQLRVFLDEELDHGVARALSRHAVAHRLGHRDEAPGKRSSGEHAPRAAAPVDAATSWSHVERAIRGEGHSAEAIAVATQQHRHDAAVHVKEMAKSTPIWIPIAVAAAAVLIALVAIRFVDSAASESALARAVNAEDVRIIDSPRARTGVVTLADSTLVRIAPESRLSIPRTFGPRVRAVKLEGAATFETRPGQEGPLHVYARDAVVEATGTVFTVRAWPGDDAVSVRVKEGTVVVRAGDATRDVAAGQTIAVGANGAFRTPDAAELARTMGWLDGTLVAEDRPLRDVLPMLSRWYGIDVGVGAADSALLERKVTLRTPLTSATAAIEAIEQQAKVVYARDKSRQLVFRDAATP